MVRAVRHFALVAFEMVDEAGDLGSARLGGAVAPTASFGFGHFGRGWLAGKEGTAVFW